MANQISIDERPAIVATRQRIGDWEGDTVIGHGHLPFAAWTDSGAILASPALSYDPRNPGAKLLLGTLDGKLIGLEDGRHMITVAGSRSGKGVSMIIPNLLFYQGSMLVIDPKGELTASPQDGGRKGSTKKSMCWTRSSERRIE